MKLNHGWYIHQIGAIHDRVFATGKVVWSCCVQANMALFSQGKRDLPMGVVYSLDPWFDSRTDQLSAIADALAALKDTSPDDPVLVELAKTVSDEEQRELNCILPESMCAGREVRYEVLFVQRHRLPDRYLAAGLLPVVVDPAYPTWPMLLPLEYWAADLIRYWKEAARQFPPQVPPASPLLTAEEYEANPVELSPAAGAEIRFIIRQKRLRNPRLRVDIQNGIWDLDIVEEIPDPAEEFVTYSEGLTILVKHASAYELAGTTVHFISDHKGKGFVFAKRK